MSLPRICDLMRPEVRALCNITCFVVQQRQPSSVLPVRVSVHTANKNMFPEDLVVCTYVELPPIDCAVELVRTLFAFKSAGLMKNLFLYATIAIGGVIVLAKIETHIDAIMLTDAGHVNLAFSVVQL
jgi:hypothetical protein